MNNRYLEDLCWRVLENKCGCFKAINQERKLVHYEENDHFVSIWIVTDLRNRNERIEIFRDLDNQKTYIYVQFLISCNKKFRWRRLELVLQGIMPYLKLHHFLSTDRVRQALRVLDSQVPPTLLEDYHEDAKELLKAQLKLHKRVFRYLASKVV